MKSDAGEGKTQFRIVLRNFIRADECFVTLRFAFCS